MARKPDLRGLMDNADDVAALLAAMAHRSRLPALCMLSKREICVGTLARELGAPHSTTSVCLGALKAQGLVSGRREGTTIYYGVSSLRVRPILATLARIYPGSEAQKRSDKRVSGQTKRNDS